MDCKVVALRLEAYGGRQLSATESAQVRAHVSSCESCAGLFERELSLRWAMHITNATPPRSLFLGVMAVVRTQPQRPPAFKLRWTDFLLAGGLTIALGAFMVGVLWLVSAGLWVTPEIGQSILTPALEQWLAPWLQVIAWTGVGLLLSAGFAGVMVLTQKRV